MVTGALLAVCIGLKLGFDPQYFLLYLFFSIPASLLMGFLPLQTSIGSTRLARRLCDLSSAGEFDQGGAKAKLSRRG